MTCGEPAEVGDEPCRSCGNHDPGELAGELPADSAERLVHLVGRSLRDRATQAQRVDGAQPEQALELRLAAQRKLLEERLATQPGGDELRKLNLQYMLAQVSRALDEVSPADGR